MFTKKWWESAITRTIKTFAESMLAFMTVGNAFNEVSWGQAASCAGLSAAICLATCVVSLPEAKDKEA